MFDTRRWKYGSKSPPLVLELPRSRMPANKAGEREGDVLARNLKQPEPERNIILAQTIAIIVIVALFGILLFTSVSRLEEYNRHICVDVYGRNERCEVIK